MDEELLNELFLYAQSQGYEGDLGYFKTIVQMDNPITTDELFNVARGDSEYGMTSNFAGGMDSFRGALGLKKEESQIQTMQTDATSVDAGATALPENMFTLPVSSQSSESGILESQHSFNTRASGENDRLSQEQERKNLFGSDNENFDYNRFPDREVFTEDQLLNEMNFNDKAFMDIWNMSLGDIPSQGTKQFKATEQYFLGIEDDPTRLAYLSTLYQSDFVVEQPETMFRITSHKHVGGGAIDIGGSQPTEDAEFNPVTLGSPEEMSGIKLEGSVLFNGKITDLVNTAPASIKLTEEVTDVNGKVSERDYVGLRRFGIVDDKAYYDEKGYDNYWLGGEEFFPLTEFLDFSHKLNVMKARSEFSMDEDYIKEREAINNKEITAGTVRATSMGGFYEPGYGYKDREQDLFDLEHEYLQKYIQQNDAVLKDEVLNWLPKSLSENENFLQKLDEDIFTENPSLYFNLSGSGDLFEQWAPVDILVNIADGAYSDLILPIVYGNVAVYESLTETSLEAMNDGEVDLGWSKAVRKHQEETRRTFSGYYDSEKGRYVPGFKTLHKTGIYDKIKSGNIMGAFGQGVDVAAQASPTVAAIVGTTIVTGGVGTAPMLASSGLMGYLAAANEYMGNYDQYLTPEDRWDSATKIGLVNFGVGLAGYGLIRPKLGQISKLRGQGRLLEAEILEYNTNRRWGKILSNNLGPAVTLGGVGGGLDAATRVELMKGRGIKLSTQEETDMIMEGVYNGVGIGAFSSIGVNYTLSRAFTNYSKFSLKMLELSNLATKDISKMSIGEVKAMLDNIPNPKHRAMVQNELIQFNVERLKIAGENDATNKLLQLRNPDKFAEMTRIDFLLHEISFRETMMKRLGRNDELITLQERAKPLLKRRIEIETKATADAEANPITDSEKGRSSINNSDEIART